MKKVFIYIIFVTSLIILRSSLLTTEENTDVTQLELWTYQAAHEVFYEEMAAEWNKLNPNEQIDLEISVIPSEDMHNKLLICANSNTGCPDISDIEIKRFPLFLEGDDIPLYNLTEYVAEYNQGLVKSRLNLYSKNNKIYGVPSHVGADVVYYNDEIMNDAGIDPGEIVTWQDYIDAGYIVKEKTGKPMTVIETSENLIIWPILVQYEADYINEEGKVDIINDQAQKIYQEIQKLIADEIIITAPGGKVHSEDFYGYMNSGAVASLPMPIWYMNRFTDYMPDLSGKISIQKYPINPQNPSSSTVGIGGTGTVVLDSSFNKDLAARFITFAKLSEDGSVRAWEELGFDPVNSDVWSTLETPEKFSEYFTNDPLDILREYDPNKIESPRINSELVDVAKEINTTMYFDIFEKDKDVITETQKAQEKFE